jgi:RNA polymerase sigma-70 factor (ECF subfamily)
MEPEALFRALIARVRAGDPEAAVELVRQFEPAVRRAVRLRLTSPRYWRLRRVIDSVDVCQSVLGNFFVRAALGQFDLETPNNLLALLVTMTYNNLTSKARKDRLPVSGGPLPVESLADATDPPSEIAAGRELLQEFLRHLSADERRLADLRAAGLSWDEVAAQVGSTNDAVRKQLERAIRRVERRLGLNGGGGV